jgi:uncharacterized protein YjiS (DUF1127 family)
MSVRQKRAAIVTGTRAAGGAEACGTPVQRTPLHSSAPDTETTMHQPITLPLPTADDLLRRAREALRSRVVAWRQRRATRVTYLALNELDARTLRDLGFDRSELASVAEDGVRPHRSDRVRWLNGPRF